MISKISKIIKIDQNREEYFENPTQNYFNPEKSQVKLIYWYKKWSFIRHVPDHYWPQDSFGYALIRWYNCQASCHYCYLQSYFKSPDLVKFTNIDDYILFLEQFIIEFKKKNWNEKKIYFYDWDFYDSFGYALLDENINDINKIIDLIEKYENVFLEIRTKATIKSISYAKLKISNKVIYAITFSPQNIIESYEPGTWNLEDRTLFAKYIQNNWWKIGVRIDPIIIDKELNISLEKYFEMITIIKQLVLEKNIANWAIWVLRIKENLYKKLNKIHSNITNNLELIDWFYTYPKNWKQTIYKQIIEKVDNNNLYICMDKLE